MTSSNSPIPSAEVIRRDHVLLGAALAPSLIAAVVFLGARPILMVVVASICAAAVEAGFAWARKGKPSVGPGLVLGGLVFPLMLPLMTPLWMVGLGAAFGVFFGKEVFGGTGHNIFHPAVVGKCFLLLGWPTAVGKIITAATAAAPVDAAAAETEGELATGLGSVLLGPGLGAVGEICLVAVLVGGVLLLATRVANWRVVLGGLVAVSATAAIFGLSAETEYMSLGAVLGSGSLMFGLLFVATDRVTSTRTNVGALIYGLIVGALAVCIRNLAYGSYTEAVMFAVLLGNLFAPMVDSIVVAASGRGGSGEESHGAGQGA